MNLANEISELLEISLTAAYDRMRCSVPLKFEEACLLCRRYGISLDAAAVHETDTVPFRYVPLAAEGPERYLRYMKGLEAAMERLSKGESKELKFAADDIPIFHFMPYAELTYFKLYAWNRTMNDVKGSYERFVHSADRPELREIFRRIASAYLQVPTIEIWTEETLDPVLQLMAHYRDLGDFTNTDTLAKLCGQLLDLIGRMEKWATVSAKGDDRGVPYHLYLSPVNLGNSIMLTQCDGVESVRIKLYTINSIATCDSRLCGETGKWLVQTISKSTHLSGSSEVQRTVFFNSMKQKVTDLTA